MKIFVKFSLSGFEIHIFGIFGAAYRPGLKNALVRFFSQSWFKNMYHDL